MNKSKVLQVGIIGCGLIGGKRAASLGNLGELVACSDVVFDRAKALASKYGCRAILEWKDLLKDDQIDVVIVSTLHDSLVEISCEAMLAGKNVLIEKPGARNVEEFQKIIETQKLTNKFVHIGFNHRYHRAVLKAKDLVDQGAIGELMFIRARYGHGARVGYESEWRAQKELSGGGELIDQGPHLIDLSSWFLGDFTQVSGFADTFYWNMDVDDNAFMTLRTLDKKTAFLHVSCTEWKNLFSFEIYGKTGKIEINGLGGSYGLERVAFYKMLPQMGPPETTIWEYPMADFSWEIENIKFFKKILNISNFEVDDTMNSAGKALKIIDSIYSN